ncbi:MAG: glutaredoxin family protein [Acidimicrobiia bacterium]
MIGIRFLTRKACPLCDEALAAIGPIAARAGVEIELVDIDLDLELLNVYNDRVPVIERSDGSVIAEGIVDVGRVEAAIADMVAADG